ncbi:MAG: RNA methyltransferase [Candidatus Wallbacteria bacterium]|nr:RNA methyltransferase [Candidatus Wallbacteria bacterium]
MSLLLSKLAAYRKDPRLVDFFLLEGKRCLEQAIQYGSSPDLLISESAASSETDFLQKYSHLNLTVLPDKLFSGKVSAVENSQGLAGVLPQFSYQLESLLACEKLFILDNLRDPGNLGAIFRIAESFSIGGLILSSGSVNAYNPKVIRASLGSIAALPFVYAGETRECIKLMKITHSVIAADPEAEAAIWDCDLTGRIALLIGNEARGLSKELLELCDRSTRVPMTGKMESLNAAHTCAIIGYELLRQKMACLKN